MDDYSRGKKTRKKLQEAKKKKKAKDTVIEIDISDDASVTVIDLTSDVAGTETKVKTSEKIKTSRQKSESSIYIVSVLM